MEIGIKWIKILTGMFDDEKIKLIEAMPEADTILVIWIKLLTLAGKKNMNGYIFLSENIPYTDEMLATIFGRPVNTIRLALDTLKKFGMIQYNKEKIIQITNWNKHQNIEGLEKIKEQNRLRQRKFRMKQKKLPMPNADNVDVTLHNGTDKNREEKKRKDIDKKKEQFNKLWSKYPNKDGKKQAEKHFNTSVKTEKDWQDINKALENYLKSERVKNNYIKNGSTWFNNWKDWVDYVELKPASQQSKRGDLEEL